MAEKKAELRAGQLADRKVVYLVERTAVQMAANLAALTAAWTVASMAVSWVA